MVQFCSTLLEFRNACGTYLQKVFGSAKMSIREKYLQVETLVEKKMGSTGQWRKRKNNIVYTVNKLMLT